jgi:mono/diheme cytochrome c family protein
LFRNKFISHSTILSDVGYKINQLKKLMIMKKVIVTIVTVLAVLIGGFILFVLLTWDKEYDTEYPAITATTDSAMIARGKYLVYGPAHCVYCHVPMDRLDDVAANKEVPLIGGMEFDIPPGKFRTPNLTPDDETGIGKLTDGEIARALRYSISHRNKLMVPFMPFQELSDEDLTAIISFLRSQEPVRNDIKPSEYNLLGKAVVALGLIKPEGPKKTPPKSVAIDTTAVYGGYLANSIANCVGCHTERDMNTGQFIGPVFAGGMRFEPDAFSKGFSFISPNITPDKETSAISGWDEPLFIDRFHAGRLHAGSPMPWEAFSRMNETDLKALFRYLASLGPVHNKIDKTAFLPGEEFPD